MGDELPQGPDAGRTHPPEHKAYDDPETGARVRRLTSDPDADSWRLYFTKNGWHDDGRQLLFRSNRDGSRDLYSIELESGEITQLTDLPGDIGGVTRIDGHETALFWCNECLVSLDLESLEGRTLYELPDGYSGSIAAGTADGSRAVTAISEDVEVDPGEDRDSWIAAREATKPHSQLSYFGVIRLPSKK